MRRAQHWFDVHRAKHPDLPDELAWDFAIRRGLLHDPAEEDEYPNALVPAEGAPQPNRKNERSRMASFFRLDAAWPITALLLDALELAWEYPERRWFHALRRLVYREGYAMPNREGYTRPEEDARVALITRTWAGRDLARIWTDERSSPTGCAAILAVAAIVLEFPQLRPEFRDELHEAARSWTEAAEFLNDVADRDVVDNSVGQLRALLRTGGLPSGAAGDNAPTEPEHGRTTRLRPCDEKAYRLYTWALDHNPSLAEGTDRAVFDWIALRPEAAEGMPERFSTWAKYLRCARAHFGDHKHTPRAARSRGRNVRRPDEL